MGIGDNFDTSIPGLMNQRTGRASGHGFLGQDDNGGHPCNVGCGCKPVCGDGIDGGSCSLPPEFRISILQLPDLCKDSNNSGIPTSDQTPEDCEANNGTCLDSEGDVKLDKDGGDYADKKSCETEEGKWETSGTWEKSSRKLARSATSEEGAFTESFSQKETFWLRYQNGYWRGRKCCGQSSYDDDSGKTLWDMDSDQCDPCDITTLSRCIERDYVARGEEQTDWERSDSEYQTFETCKGYPEVSDDKKEREWERDTTSTEDCSYYGKSGGHSNRPYIDKNSPKPQKYTLGQKVYGKFSLQDLLIEWWGDENPYQPSISIERQHLANIFRMGRIGDSLFDPSNRTVNNPFYSHYRNIISTNQACLPDGERFPRINGCMDTDDAIVTIPWQVCYKSSCTQSEYITKTKCEDNGGEWNLFVIDDSHAGDVGHETACKDAGYDLYKDDIFLDEKQCYELAKCVDSEGEEVHQCSDTSYKNQSDCVKNDETWSAIRSKWDCLEKGSPKDDYGNAGVKNKWTQEWELLDRENSEAIITGGVGSDTCCGGEGIGDTSPAWVSEIKMGRQSTKGQRQNTCITPYKEVTLIPEISSTSVIDVGSMGCTASTSPWQRGEEGYPEIANSGFTLIIKDCDYWGNCYDFVEECSDSTYTNKTDCLRYAASNKNTWSKNSNGTGEVTVLYIPMDQIMNCTNFRKTGVEWREEFSWWGNPVGFYPGDPQETGAGSYSRHLNWCYRTDENQNGVADWSESGKGTGAATYTQHNVYTDEALTVPNSWRKKFKLDGKQPIPYLYGDAEGQHFGDDKWQEEIDYDHGTCSVALYWENTLGLTPHNARSQHAPGDFAIRNLNLQQQPFKATEKKQNYYKTLAQAKADRGAFDGCINGNFGGYCPWTGLAYWFEHDFVAWGDHAVCKEIGEKLQKYTRGMEDLTDPGRCLFNPKFTETSNSETNHFEYQTQVCVCDGGIYYRDPDNPNSCPATIVDPVLTYNDENGHPQPVVHECEKLPKTPLECDCIRNPDGECYSITGPLPDSYGDTEDPLMKCYMECLEMTWTGCSDSRYVSFESCMDAGADWGGSGTAGEIIRRRNGSNVVGRVDCSALASGRPERIATWNIYDQIDKYTDGFGEDLKQFVEPGTPEAMDEGNVWNMKPEVLAIINDARIVVQNSKFQQNLDYWGRTGLYPDAAKSSNVIDTCSAQNTTKTIEYASNTTPIIVRSNRHGIMDGDHVWTYGVQGNFKANVMTVGEWMETQWDTKIAKTCPPPNSTMDCNKSFNPSIVCPCNDGNLYGKDNEHCSGVIVKGKQPDPADFFVAKYVNDDEYALYTCDGMPADGEVDVVPIGGDSEACDREKPGERICASMFVSPMEIPSAQVEVVTGNNGLPIIQEKFPGTSLDSKDVCVDYINCAVVNPPYDPKWSIMTKPECELLRSNYDSVEVLSNGNIEYRPFPPTNSGRVAMCGDECFYPLTWMRKHDFKIMTGELQQGASSWPACAFTGEWTLRNVGDPYTYEGDKNALAYRTGWTDIFDKDSNKGQDYYVWMHNDETCPTCCDQFLPDTLYATVTGDRDKGGSTEIYNYAFNNGEIATTLHDPAGDKCSDNSPDNEATCKSNDNEWIRGRLETTVPCGMDKCTGEMYKEVTNFWGLPVGGRYCCDCGTYPPPLGGHGSWHQKCFDCGNALRFDDPRWPDQVTKHALNTSGGDESGKSWNDFCCDCDCDPGPDFHNLAKQYPTAQMVMDAMSDGCTGTIGNLTCAYETFEEVCEPNPAITMCYDIKNETDCLAKGLFNCSDATYLTQAECTGAGATWSATASGCEWSDQGYSGEPTCNDDPEIIYPCHEYNSACVDSSGSYLGHTTQKLCEEASPPGIWRDAITGCEANARCHKSGGYQTCICGDFANVPCFGFPNGRAMDCEPEIVTSHGYPVGCPSEPRGNWMVDHKTEVWTNPLARPNLRYGGTGCGLPSMGALPTTDCYDFIPLDGLHNTGGPKDYKDGCHGMSPRTIRMDYNGSHWVSNWEPMMGDSPTRKKLASSRDYDAFVGGMSCEHYYTPDKCHISMCFGGRSNFIQCSTKQTCEGTDVNHCDGEWLSTHEWQPGNAMGNMDMDKNCGDCATNSWSSFKEPPVPTPQHDAHLMRVKLGCGGIFQEYPSRGTMLTGDHYRNNQLNMFLEVTHCSYTTCSPLSVTSSFRPPCPNMFELPATRDGTIDPDNGTYKVGINTSDEYFSKGSCLFRWHDEDANGALTIERETDSYCKFPVREDYLWPNGPKKDTTEIFDCSYTNLPTEEEHPSTPTPKHCYQLGLTYGECVSTELDKHCGMPQCTGVMVIADEELECTNDTYEWRNRQECNSGTQIGKEWCEEGGWTDPYNPYPYYHGCANWNGVISTPGFNCDAQLPCTECCGFNGSVANLGGNVVSCASASLLGQGGGNLGNGIPGTQVPNGKWINSTLGGKSPEVFEVVYTDVVNNSYGVAKLVVRKNSQKACGWASGSVVSIGMADRNEAETGTYPGTTRDKLSRNPYTDSKHRMKTELGQPIPDGQQRWGINKDKIVTKPSEYMEIFVKDPTMLFSRANLLDQDLYRGPDRPIDRERNANEPWPYGDGLWPVGHQSNGKVPSATANRLQLESIGSFYVRDTRVGFLPTLSNIDDPDKAVFLSDLPKIETRYLDDEMTQPDNLYHNTFNMSLSIKEVENVYDKEASFCTNTNYEDKATCESVGRCELLVEIEDQGKAEEFIPGQFKVTITGYDEAACGKTHTLSNGSKKKDVWIKTAWWRPKFLYTKLTTFEEHDLSDGEKIILSGGQSVTATCEDVVGVHRTPDGNPMFDKIPELPEGMDMSMIDQVLCEDSLYGVWTYEPSDTDTVVRGCPPLCQLDQLIGIDHCDVTHCPDCFNLIDSCLEKSPPSRVWKENFDISENNCISSGNTLRKFRKGEDVCPRSSFDGEHVVKTIEGDKKSIIIVAESRSDISNGQQRAGSIFVDNSDCVQEPITSKQAKEMGIDFTPEAIQEFQSKECNANQFTNHCYWSAKCVHQSECDKLDDHGCKISPFCTYYPAILDDDGEQTAPGHCQEEATAGDPLMTSDLQKLTNQKLPLVKMGHEVMLGSPKNIYKAEQYITPTPDSLYKPNYGPYFGSKWSRHGGRFRIRVGQELPLDDCHQGDSSTPTMLHWLFTFPDEVCNHYLPIIDADCGPTHCNRGYGPFTEPLMGGFNNFGFNAEGLLRIDVHDGGSGQRSLSGPVKGTTYPE